MAGLGSLKECFCCFQAAFAVRIRQPENMIYVIFNLARCAAAYP
ncbi:hypothetical protein [Kingella sp. (in: b-proteobacteria)]|nr:hypothetical protein [Kingella sp. (in: b-proteobacteria)]MDO4658234.1 hypothetical protein [Kingella sp. (in: b-proteobacteria)]